MSLFTSEQADAVETIEVSDDEQYTLVVTLENPCLAQSFESLTHWVDPITDEWHSDLVYWWLCELQNDGRYHAIEWFGTCEEAAHDAWTLYAEGDERPVAPLIALREGVSALINRLSVRAS